MIGDDLDSDIDGAQKCGLKAVLVRTGKFRQEDLDGSPSTPTASSTRSPSSPSGWSGVRIGVDLIEIGRVARALERYPGFRSAVSPRPSARTATREPGSTTRRGSPARRRSAGAGIGRQLHLAGDRDPRPPEARRASFRQDGRVGGTRRGRRDRAVHDSFSRPRRRRVSCRPVMFEPLYTSAEMRDAEERYPGYPGTIPELMERAGGAVADAVSSAIRARGWWRCAARARTEGDGRIAAEKLGGQVVEVGRGGAAGRGRARGRPVRHRLPWRTAPRGCRPDRADQHRRSARRRGRRPVRRGCVDRGGGRCRRPRAADRDVPRVEGRARRCAGRFHAGASSSPASVSSPPRRGTAGR